jgi:hypothetical protein
MATCSPPERTGSTRPSRPPDDLAYVSDKGEPFSRHNRKWWRAGVRAAGLPTGTRVHDLRHAGLTMAAQSGATPKELMTMAGHSSSRAALLYQHAATERAQTVAAAVSEPAHQAGLVRRSGPVQRCPERAGVVWIGHVAGTRPLSAILERGLVAGQTCSDLRFSRVELRGLEPLTPTLPAGLGVTLQVHTGLS